MGCGYSKLVSLDAGQRKTGISCRQAEKRPKTVQMQEFQTLS